MLNKVILMGRLTRDPEARATNSGVSMATFTLAVDRGYTKAGEERIADFIPIIVFRSTADFVMRYFKKGQMMAVTGRLQVRTWNDNEGKKRYATEVLADEVFFAEGKKDGGEYSNYNSAYDEGTVTERPSNVQYNSPTNINNGPDGFMATADDDDLPF